jgi:hypothetical protein
MPMALLLTASERSVSALSQRTFPQVSAAQEMKGVATSGVGILCTHMQKRLEISGQGVMETHPRVSLCI